MKCDNQPMRLLNQDDPLTLCLVLQEALNLQWCTNLMVALRPNSYAPHQWLLVIFHLLQWYQVTAKSSKMPVLFTISTQCYIQTQKKTGADMHVCAYAYVAFSPGQLHAPCLVLLIHFAPYPQLDWLYSTHSTTEYQWIMKNAKEVVGPNLRNYSTTQQN
jgi:hypothetical protein